MFLFFIVALGSANSLKDMLNGPIKKYLAFVSIFSNGL